MSIQARSRKKGRVFVVHYYDVDRKKYVNKTFDRKRDAEAFEAQVVLAKRRGDLAMFDAGREQLSEFVAEWWETYAARQLAPKTLKQYRTLLDRFVLPHLGTHPLRRLNAPIINRWVAALEEQGVGPESIRKTLAMLQGIMRCALEWERVPSNPVQLVRKPPASRARTPRPLAPAEIEAIRHKLSDRDAALVSVLAYGGLRPGEALGLTWEDIGERSINVERAISLGEERSTKNRRVRQVELLAALRQDLLEWKARSGRREGLVFPGHDGHPWTETAYRNWRRRVFAPIAPAGVRPYDLRHSFASLHFAAGKNPAWIADQTGHTLQTLLSTYVRVIAEVGTERVDAEELIAAAR